MQLNLRLRLVTITAASLSFGTSLQTTNQTALRARLSALLADHDQDRDHDIAATLDYVNYTNGLDTVHYPLPHP
jgi:hypothetical protein